MGTSVYIGSVSKNVSDNNAPILLYTSLLNLTTRDTIIKKQIFDFAEDSKITKDGKSILYGKELA